MMFTKMIFLLTVYIIAMLLLAATFVAQASCTLTTSAVTINIPEVSLTPQRNGAVNTVLYSYQVTVPQLGYSCGTGVQSTWRSSYTRPEMSLSAISNVYNTGISGIGMRIKWPESRASNSWVPGSYSCQGNCIEPSDKITVEFIQTGVAQSGTIDSGSVVTISVSADNDPQNTLNLMTVNLGEVTVNVGSCAIYASSNSVDLGSYSLAKIQKAGFTGDKKDFTITLDCPSSSSADILFEGTVPYGWANSSGVMKNTGSAENSYVRLYQKSGQIYTAQGLNANESFGDGAFTGVRTVTYAGEMYFDESTRSSVTAGTVAADVIYTLTIN